MPVDPVATRRFIESLSTHLEDHLASWKSQLADTRNEINELISKAVREHSRAGQAPLPRGPRRGAPRGRRAARARTRADRREGRRDGRRDRDRPRPAPAPDWGLVQGVDLLDRSRPGRRSTS